MKNKKLESIHIDLNKGIFELNGKPMCCVKELDLRTYEDDGSTRWSLRIAKDEFYSGCTGQKVTDEA